MRCDRAALAGLALVALAGLAGCGKADAPAPGAAPAASAAADGKAPGEVKAASPEQVKTLLAQGATLVDVREPDETSGGVVTPALTVPFSTTRDSGAWTKFVAGLTPGKPVVTYCAAGGRAQKVAERLSKQGFTVYNGGGYEALAQAGLPTRKP